MNAEPEGDQIGVGEKGSLETEGEGGDEVFNESVDDIMDEIMAGGRGNTATNGTQKKTPSLMLQWRAPGTLCEPPGASRRPMHT